MARSIRARNTGQVQTVSSLFYWYFQTCVSGAEFHVLQITRLQDPARLRFPRSSSHPRSPQSLLSAPPAHDQASSPDKQESKYFSLTIRVQVQPQKSPYYRRLRVMVYSTLVANHQSRYKDDGVQNYLGSDQKVSL